MKRGYRLLLVPSLAPLLLIIVVGCLNLRQETQLRILTWKTPRLSLGFVMILASASGAIISSINSTLPYLPKQPLRRKAFKTNFKTSEYKETHSDQIINRSEDKNPVFHPFNEKHEKMYVPERDVRDPSPTMSVPYRIINNNESNFPERQDFDLDQEEDILDNSYMEEVTNNSRGYKSSVNDDWGSEPYGNW